MAFYKTMVAITIAVAAVMWGLCTMVTFGWTIVGVLSVTIVYTIVLAVVSDIERD
jgi:hypothetical protein